MKNVIPLIKVEEEISNSESSYETEQLKEKLTNLKMSHENPTSNIFDNMDEKLIYSKKFVNKIIMQDIYSTAVLILHCVESIPPAQRKQPLSKAKINYLLELVKQYFSESLYEMIEKMLHPEPFLRMSMFEIKNCLKKIQGQSMTMSF